MPHLIPVCLVLELSVCLHVTERFSEVGGRKHFFSSVALRVLEKTDNDRTENNMVTVLRLRITPGRPGAFIKPLS